MPEVMEEPAAARSLKKILDLGMFMETTHSPREYEKFMIICRHEAARSGLSNNKFWADQDPEKLQRYIEKVTKKDKNLGKYVNFWPVRVLFDLRAGNYINGKYVRYAKVVEPQRRQDKSSWKASSTQSTVPPGPSEPARFRIRLRGPERRCPDSASPRRVFVGKPPRDMNPNTTFRFLSCSPEPGPAQPTHPKTQLTKPNQPNHHTSPSKCAEPIVCDGSDDELDVAPCSDLPWTPSLMTAPRAPPIQVVYVGCLDCGRPVPRESAGSNQKLKLIVGEDSSLHFRAIFNAGLTNDRQLSLFLGWPTKYRCSLIENLVASGFVKQGLRRQLLPFQAWGEDILIYEDGNAGSKEKESAAMHGVPQPNNTFSGVLQPSAEAEEKLTDPDESVELLYQAMDLGGNRKLFNEVLAYAEKCGLPYLSTYKPSVELFEEVVKKICDGRIAWERYEDQWPIRFILKRVARKHGCKPIDDHLRPTQPPPPSPPSQHRPKLTLKKPCQTQRSPPAQPKKTDSMPWISHTCPTHTGVDVQSVSRNIQQFLHFFGLSDLIPVFAMVGVRSDEDMQQFCVFSDEEKDRVLDDYGTGRIVKVNQFQRIAMKTEFTEEKAKGFIQFAKSK
ncbi:hypothetical protein D9611_004903 [Ephemerocybe angulata]|uniref:Uncharacterized protein n=1 Tax=Ephemerocybe angulata TaxID=980116 RepID=A0A8H5B512_9AGAR|nr:hypothetical protein D9611_004903 [Tulosesus angulatus]